MHLLFYMLNCVAFFPFPWCPKWRPKVPYFRVLLSFTTFIVLIGANHTSHTLNLLFFSWFGYVLIVTNIRIIGVWRLNMCLQRRLSRVDLISYQHLSKRCWEISSKRNHMVYMSSIFLRKKYTLKFEILDLVSKRNFYYQDFWLLLPDRFFGSCMYVFNLIRMSR